MFIFIFKLIDGGSFSSGIKEGCRQIDLLHCTTGMGEGEVEVGVSLTAYLRCLYDARGIGLDCTYVLAGSEARLVSVFPLRRVGR